MTLIFTNQVMAVMPLNIGEWGMCGFIVSFQGWPDPLRTILLPLSPSQQVESLSSYLPWCTTPFNPWIMGSSAELSLWLTYMQRIQDWLHLLWHQAEQSQFNLLKRKKKILSNKLLSSHVYNGSSPNAKGTWCNKIKWGRLN